MTHPGLNALIMSALKTLLDGGDTDDIAYPEDMTDHADAQLNIGWEHMLKGRFSKLWTQTQDQHLKQHNLKTKRKNGQSWLTGLIHEMFKQWWDFWEARNDDRHGKDAQSQAQADNRQAIHELELLYAKYTSTNIHPDLTWLLETTFDIRAQWPTSSIRQWLNTWEPVLQESYNTRLETG